MNIAVMGPAGDDECAHYIHDGLKAIGCNVRLIDPLRARETVLEHLGPVAMNEHYSQRKPISLEWLKNAMVDMKWPNTEAAKEADLRECQIIIITDQPVEYINDLLP